MLFLFHQEHFAVAQRLLHFGAEASWRKRIRFRYKLPIEPGGTDGTDLPLNRDFSMDVNQHTPAAPGVIDAAAFDKVWGYAPNTLFQALDDSIAPQRFQATQMRLDVGFRIAFALGGDGLVPIDPIDTILGQPLDGSIGWTNFRASANGDECPDWILRKLSSAGQRNVVRPAIDAVDDQVAALMEFVGKTFARNAASDSGSRLRRVKDREASLPR
jgi:hypothetical protein